MTTPDVDLFGNPVDPQPPAPVATEPAVNDMDLVQSVLADIVSERTPLHRDDTGIVRRCDGQDTAPVSAAVAATVNQLLAGRYLTTTRRHRACLNDDHDAEVVTTPAGRNAACRWNTLHRPAAWGPSAGAA